MNCMVLLLGGKKPNKYMGQTRAENLQATRVPRLPVSSATSFPIVPPRQHPRARGVLHQPVRKQQPLPQPVSCQSSVPSPEPRTGAAGPLLQSRHHTGAGFSGSPPQHPVQRGSWMDFPLSGCSS